MFLKLLLKIWPALTPIILYIFWTFIIEGILIKKLLKKSSIIATSKRKNKDKEEYVINEVGTFSLQNKKFVIVLYISLILGIATMLNFAF